MLTDSTRVTSDSSPQSQMLDVLNAYLGGSEQTDRNNLTPQSSDRLDAMEALTAFGEASQSIVKVTDADGKRRPQTNILIDLAAGLELFHDGQGNTYAIIDNGHGEVWPIGSSSFTEYLSGCYYQMTGCGANRNSMRDAVTTISSRARFDCPERKVFVRVAEVDSTIYVDLGDPDWRVIEITSSGWRVLKKSPVMFTRSQTAMALPEPKSGGSVDLLFPFINVADVDQSLVTGWILNTYGRGPFIHLALIGEQGTAKSTTARILKAITDPSSMPLRAPPKDEETLLIAAVHSRVIAFDNLSGITPQLSDALCRLSTGGGLSKRQLYTDGEEFALDLQRPCILNGIDDIASRPDLSERTITLQLQPIHQRKEERELWAEFEKSKPLIFGAICDSLSAGLRYAQDLKIENLPRMADAASWITACEQADGWTSGAFITAFHRNQREAVSISLEASPVTSALIQLMESRSEWNGTATELLRFLTSLVDDDTRRSKAWPKSGDWLTKTLRRFGNPLRSVGINVEQDRTADARTIKIKKRATADLSRHSRHGVTDDDAMTAMTPFSPVRIHDAMTPAPPALSNGGATQCRRCAGEGCRWCDPTG